MNVSEWKQRDRWTGKEFTLLLLLEFIFVMVVVKYGIQSLYHFLFNNTLYSGKLTGLTIAIVLMTGLHIIAIRPKRTFVERGRGKKFFYKVLVENSDMVIANHYFKRSYSIINKFNR